MASHYLPFFCEAQGVLQRAACGAFIFPNQHSAEPNCERCLDYITSEQLALDVAERHDARRETPKDHR